MSETTNTTGPIARANVMRHTWTCPTCGGDGEPVRRGWEVIHACPTCGGGGRVEPEGGQP